MSNMQHLAQVEDNHLLLLNASGGSPIAPVIAENAEFKSPVVEGFWSSLLVMETTKGWRHAPSSTAPASGESCSMEA